MPSNTLKHEIIGMENKLLKVLTLGFGNEITEQEVHLFRGAVVSALQDMSKTLFHNHCGDEGFRYSYPLIQYKRIGGKAAMICLEDGCDELPNIIAINGKELRLGRRSIVLKMEYVTSEDVPMRITDDYHRYSLTSWLPLNMENYHAYRSLDSLVDKILLLQNILRGNIVSAAKGLHVEVDKPLEAIITECSPQMTVETKGVKLAAFNIEFLSNILLPDHIGLGKSVSKGFGILESKKKEL